MRRCMLTRKESDLTTSGIRSCFRLLEEKKGRGKKRLNGEKLGFANAVFMLSACCVEACPVCQRGMTREVKRTCVCV